jgi:periplasmic divalent cation tolerance protein
MKPNELLIVLATCSIQEAPHLADLLVIEKLAACVNILPANSVYFWNNELKHDNESLLIIKTMAHKYSELESRLREIHPYDIPEIIALKAEQVQDSYLKWVIEQTK